MNHLNTVTVTLLLGLLTASMPFQDVADLESSDSSTAGHEWNALTSVVFSNGGIQMVLSPDPGEGFRHLGVGQTGRLSLRTVTVSDSGLSTLEDDQLLDICSTGRRRIFSHLDILPPGPNGIASGAFTTNGKHPVINVFRGPDLLMSFDTVLGAYNRECDCGVFAASLEVPNGAPIHFTEIGNPQMELEGDQLVIYASSSDAQFPPELVHVRADLDVRPPLSGTVLRIPLVSQEGGSAPQGTPIASGVSPTLAGPAFSGRRVMATGLRPARLALWQESEDGAWTRSLLSDEPIYCGKDFDLLHTASGTILVAWHFTAYSATMPVIPDSVSLGAWRHSSEEQRWIPIAPPGGAALTIPVPSGCELPGLHLVSQGSAADAQSAGSFLLYGDNPDNMLVEPLSHYQAIVSVDEED